MDISAEAVAGLAAGAINNLLDEGCCPECCAPCGALAWLRDNRLEELDEAIVTHLGGGWMWQTSDGRIDWAVVNRSWACQNQPPCGRRSML